MRCKAARLNITPCSTNVRLTDDQDSVLIFLVCYSDECGLSDDLKEMLIEAQEQDRLTCGIYESGKLLEM